MESLRVRLDFLPSAFARPKSVILGVPSPAKSTFDGFKSRWSIESRCACADAAGDLFGKPRGLLGVPGYPIEPLIETAAGDILQLEERQPVGLADMVYLDDIRMLELSDCLGFRHEADGGLRRGMRTGEDHLESAGAIEPDPPRLVHDAHAAAAEHAEDLVSGNGGKGS